MTHKHKLLTLLLPSFFLFTITSPAQQSDNYTKNQLIKGGINVGVKQLNDGMDLLKEQYGLIPLDKQAQINLYNKQSELADQQIAGCAKQDKLNDQQAELNDKQSTLTDKQIELTDEQIEDNKFDKDLKTVTLAKEAIPFLDSNDPAVKSTKNKIRGLLLKRTEHLDEVPEEKKSEETKKPEDGKPKQDGFFTSLAAYCILGAVAARDTADAIAEYTFKNITDLDCFKDTFIGKHSLGINRALVTVTATIIAYKSYSFYKAYQAERNFKEEDIFNDDLD